MFKRISFILFLLIIVDNGLLAYDRLKISPSDDYISFFPQKQVLALALIKKDNSVVFSSICTSIDDKTNWIKYENIWPEGSLTGYLDKSLYLKKTTRMEFKGTQTVKVSFGNKIVDLPYDKRLVEYDYKNSKMNIIYYLNNQEQTRFSMSFGSDDIDIDLIGLYFQALLYKNSAKNLNTEVLLADMRRGLNVDILFQTTKDFLAISPEYKDQFPDKIKKISKLVEEVNVFIIQPTGLASIFYPHKFYLFFEKTYPFSLIAWWGGAPKDVLFFVAADRLPQS